MDGVEDDSWVREFGVSNPQKTHAGYTVYRVSSKVYPKGFPEAASEVIVFKRYSEIRMLYKELKVVYEGKNGQKKQFPHLKKAHFFSRFDESVIEERQKQALLLLNFAGNISYLFTSQPFVKFFEGGVEHASRGSSRDLSESDQQLNNGDHEGSKEDCVEMEPWTPETYLTDDWDNLELNSSDDEEYEVKRDPSNLDLTLDLKNDRDSENLHAAMDSSKKTWLARAMSLCSEGDDIEALASQAGCVDHELSKAEKESVEHGNKCETHDLLNRDSRPSEASVDLLPTLLESSEGEDEDVFVENISPNSVNKEDSLSSFCVTDDPAKALQIRLSTDPEKDPSEDSFVKSDIVAEFDESEVSKYAEEPTAMPATQPGEDDVGTSEVTEQKKKGHQQAGRLVSNINVSWIDPKKKDYLYHAAQIIQQALYCEANEMYEDAFNKYKMCVGILLKGVQHDSNSNRREAVRRKTAQYLVKAEFLFNTYLKVEEESASGDGSVKIQNTPEDVSLQNIFGRQFSQVTLRNLKVIGIINKVMLVQCQGLDDVFVLKVLHKTNAVHRSARQESKQINKGFSKKYVKSAHMVKLHRHFETSNSILLLLNYASGGTLWNHVCNLRAHLNVRKEDCERDCENEATSGQRTDTQDVQLDIGSSEVHRTDDIDIVNSSTTNVSSLDSPGSCRAESSNTRNVSEGKDNSDDNLVGNLSVGKTDPDKTSLKCGETSGDTHAHQETTSCPVFGNLDQITIGNPLAEDYVRRWIAELLMAVASVHSCGIILKDLKPANVLLDGSNRVLLSYFGVWEEVDHSVDPDCVDQLYCAPEICRGEKITLAADWWSLGVLSYELITGENLSSTHPWGVHPYSSISFPSNVSAEARSFLTGLICHNVKERLGSGMNGVEEIKSHAFFKGIDWDELSSRS